VFDSVRVALSAGAPLPEGLFDRFDEQFGLPIRQDYGTTETGTIALDVGEGADPTSVGRLLPHLEVRIGPEGGSEGEIAVRGNAVAQGYVVEGRLVPCTDDNGWYHTLDLGSLGNGGRLRLVGRERPGITIGGVTVDPAGVEAAVLAVPGTREAVALQVPTPEGQALKLVVTGDVRLQDLLRWSKDHLAGLGGHVLVELRQDLPRSPAGKLLRKYLQ
jgi:long-chain acyl-CoA synthetase